MHKIEERSSVRKLQIKPTNESFKAGRTFSFFAVVGATLLLARFADKSNIHESAQSKTESAQCKTV